MYLLMQIVVSLIDLELLIFEEHGQSIKLLAQLGLNRQLVAALPQIEFEGLFQRQSHGMLVSICRFSFNRELA